MAKKLENGTRVRVTGDLSTWTTIAQQNLPGTKGEVVDYKPDYDSGYPAHLVRFDAPVRVNPISTFEQAWISLDNLTKE